MKAKFPALFLAFTGFLFIINISCSQTGVQSRQIENINQTNQETTTVTTNANQKDKVEIKSDNPNVIILKPSTILEDLKERRNANPNLSAKELADFGNSLLLLKGFNYNISFCDVIEKKIKAKEVKDIKGKDEYSSYVSFSYRMNLIDSTKKTFQILAPNFESCCCGYCYTDFPVIKITDKEMTLVSDGKNYTVKRTKDLSQSEEYFLVDNETMLKNIHKWQIPFEGEPLGISEDGKKVYVDFFNDRDIVLEISDDGSFKFADRKALKSSEGVFVENHPEDKKNAYLAFKRFNVGNKSYTIKFSGPCT